MARAMMAENVQPLFSPDVAVIRSHLEELFSRARVEYPNGLCEIAYTGRDGKPDKAQMFPITAEGLDKAAQFAADMNNLKLNVYVGGNPRKPGTPIGKRANASHIEYAVLNFADVDKPAGLP